MSYDNNNTTITAVQLEASPLIYKYKQTPGPICLTAYIPAINTATEEIVGDG